MPYIRAIYLILGSLLATPTMLTADSVTFNFLLTDENPYLAEANIDIESIEEIQDEKDYGSSEQSSDTTAKQSIRSITGSNQCHGNTIQITTKSFLQGPPTLFQQNKNDGALYTTQPLVLGPPIGTRIPQSIRGSHQDVHSAETTPGKVQQFIHGRNQNTIRFSTHSHEWKNRLPSIRSSETAQRVAAASTYRDRVHTQYRDRHTWFSSYFWDQHHYHPHFWGNNFNCWNYTSWPFLTAWCGRDWTYPDYYDSGYSISVTSPDDESYLQEDLGEAPSLDATASWQPLGVFAMSPSQDWDETPQMFLQLAIEKNGTLSGTFYNHQTDETFPLCGEIDPQSQRAVWEITGAAEHPIFETGLYNLTLPETSVQVHFSDLDIENWLLIRVQ